MDKGEIAREETNKVTAYAERYRIHLYRQVFSHPVSGDWTVDALYPEGFFESAKLLLDGVVAGRLQEGVHGVAAVLLCRHYLELELKYTLFHSRWLREETRNALDCEIVPVARGHNLQKIWDLLMRELITRVPSVLTSGFDLKFITAFVAEFHNVDEHGWRFRYPRECIAVLPPSEPYPATLGISYDSLLPNFIHTHDVLDALDSHLVEKHGVNEEWACIQNNY